MTLKIDSLMLWQTVFDKGNVKLLNFDGINILLFNSTTNFLAKNERLSNNILNLSAKNAHFLELLNSQ